MPLPRGGFLTAASGFGIPPNVGSTGGAVESLAAVAASGAYLPTLEALRDRVAQQIDLTDSARDVAALSQRMLDVTAAIEAAKRAQPEAKGTPLDELARRRAVGKPAARPSAAAGDDV